MENSGVLKVLNVWETKNKILKPSKKDLYFEVIDQMASLFSAGSFYYYILNFENLEMEMVHEGTKSILGIDPVDFTLDKLLHIIHPDDIIKMHEKESIASEFLFNMIPKEDIPLYKVVYLMRLKNTDGSYKTILHQAKCLLVSEGGKVQKVLGIHTDITYLNMPIDHKISFLSSSRPCYVASDSNGKIVPKHANCVKNLSEREREILQKMSEGKDFKQIAKELFLSPHTINTHKKNILKKSDCKNATELVARCIREGMI